MVSIDPLPLYAHGITDFVNFASELNGHHSAYQTVFIAVGERCVKLNVKLKSVVFFLKTMIMYWTEITFV